MSHLRAALLPSLCPSAPVTDLSSRKSSAWTSPGHHKTGLHAHRAITGDRGKLNGGELWLVQVEMTYHSEDADSSLVRWS
ncbi:MAG TPA: hypothetical protein VEH81_00135 [Ktedonobacteraceae bacterium]|nr:hypothetical protein [Ktedonobacteraceae bacterium]